MKRETIQNRIIELELKRDRYLRLAQKGAYDHDPYDDSDWYYCQDKAAKIQKKIDKLQAKLEA